jgi:hypothetical protein
MGYDRHCGSSGSTSISISPTSCSASSVFCKVFDRPIGKCEDEIDSFSGRRPQQPECWRLKCAGRVIFAVIARELEILLDFEIAATIRVQALFLRRNVEPKQVRQGENFQGQVLCNYRGLTRIGQSGFHQFIVGTITRTIPICDHFFKNDLQLVSTLSRAVEDRPPKRSKGLWPCSRQSLTMV